ncbi:MAG: nucleotidyltransferase domain-containing protein, partial [Fimbriimonadales bacterium]
IESVVGDVPMELYLYGSRARGDATPESDWDFLLILPDELAQTRRRAVQDVLYEIELDANEVFSCIVMSRSDWDFIKSAETPFAMNVQREGIQL